MRRATRITTASVACVVSLVLAFLGTGLLMVSGMGLTAHLFLPATKLKEPPTLAPLGPPTTESLYPGLRLSILRGEFAGGFDGAQVRAGVVSIDHKWANPFAARWRGYLEVTEPGPYRFRLRASQDATLVLNGRTLVGLHAPWHLREYVLKEAVTVYLEAGLHTLAIDHQAPSRPGPDAVLRVRWSSGNSDWQEIPEARLWSADTNTGWLEEAPSLLPPPHAPEDEELARRHLVGLPMAGPGFSSNHAFYAAFADRWDFTRFRRMEHFPGFEVLWRGKIRVSEKRSHRLVAETAGAVGIRLDNRAVEAPADGGPLTWSGELEPGWHDLSVSFLSPWPLDTLSLSWDGEGPDLRSISASRLRPLSQDEVWFAARKRLAWSVLTLGAVGALLTLLWLLRLRAIRTGEALGGLRRGGYALALCLIVLLGLGLRLHRYNEVPHLLISSDEYHNAWKGWHLMHGEGLRAWTPLRYLDFYEPEQIDPYEWADLKIYRVKPNFDRPPLFPLVLGAFDAVVGRAESFWEVGPAQFRLLPIALSMLCLPLVAWLTRRIYGSRGAALLAALLFSAVPSLVLNHRQAKSDMLVVLLVLVGLYAAFRHLDTDRKAWLWAAALAAGLAGWSKEVGVVAVAIIPYVWLRQKRWREGLTVAAVAGSIFALYFVWGSWVDYDIFWSVVRGQAAQASSFDAAWRFLTEAKLVQLPLPFAVGWTLWLWIAVAYVAPRDELPALAAVCFLLVISSVVRIEWIFGWYWVPIFPFLCMAGGVYLYDMVRRPDLVRGALFVVTALMMAVHVQRGGGPEPLSVTRGVILLTLLPFAVATFFPHRRIVQGARVWAALIVLATLALGAAQAVLYE